MQAAIESRRINAGEDQSAGEQRPLLRHAGSRRRPLCVLAPLLWICLLERCTFYEYASDLLNSGESNSDQPNCGILGNSSNNSIRDIDLSTSWQSQTLFGLAFLLPLLGGFASDWYCGCLRVLQSGCALYCLGAWLMVYSIYNSVCSSAIRYPSQVALALATGLIRPCLMVMSYEVGEAVLGTTGLCHLYYACEAAGQIIGCLLSYATDRLEKPLTFSCLPTTHTMACLAICSIRIRRQGWDPSQFQLPTWPRIRRILIVIAPIILLSCVLMLTSFTFGGLELTLLGGQSSQKDNITNSDFLTLMWSCAMLPAVAASALLTHRIAKLRSQTLRISIGILVLALSQITSFLIMSKSSGDTSNVSKYLFDSQTALWAVAEVLTFIPANEIAFLIAPEESRGFIVGLFMSLRGSGFFASILVLIGLSFTSNGWSMQSGLLIAHLCFGAALLAALVYFVCTAQKALRWLIDVEESSRRAEVQYRVLHSRPMEQDDAL